MKTHQFPQPTLTARSINQRRWLWLGLGLSAIVATLAISFYAARSPQAQLAQPTLAQRQAVDAATQGVTGYLNAHRVAETRQLDAATQGVNGYLRAHGIVQLTTR